MAFRFTPACICCQEGDPCIIHQDTFDGTGALNANYEVFGTDAERSTGNLLLDDETRVIVTIDNPDTSPEQEISINAFPAHAGWSGALIVGWVDDDNYIYYKFTRGTPGEIELFERVAGVDSSLGAPLVTNVSGTDRHRACYSNGRLTGEVIGGQSLSVAVTATGLRVGVRTFNEGFQWDNIQTERRNVDDCPDCGCFCGVYEASDGNIYSNDFSTALGAGWTGTIPGNTWKILAGAAVLDTNIGGGDTLYRIYSINNSNLVLIIEANVDAYSEFSDQFQSAGISLRVSTFASQNYFGFFRGVSGNAIGHAFGVNQNNFNIFGFSFPSKLTIKISWCFNDGEDDWFIACYFVDETPVLQTEPTKFDFGVSASWRFGISLAGGVGSGGSGDVGDIEDYSIHMSS